MPSLEIIRRVVAEAIRPAHFFVADADSLEWQHADAEEIPWEVFRGLLLDRTQTVLRRSFAAWNISARGTEPLLSVLLDATAGQLHVTRSVHCYAWEGYHAGDNVYLSREVRKWVRELIGTIDLAAFEDPAALREELQSLLFRAVVGTSRLPLTSVEAPLPGFVLGQFAYLPLPAREANDLPAAPLQTRPDLVRRCLHGEMSQLARARHLEFLLRSTPAEELSVITGLYLRRWEGIGDEPNQISALLRRMFDEVALSPYTDFVDHVLRFVELLVGRGAIPGAAQVDFLGYLLRHLARHLTAYDLITFHHRGANYPDALLLDAVMKGYLSLVEEWPALFAVAERDGGESNRQRMRRRALRQGWLLRRSYEGFLVPDAPTSPGENARVLPPPHRRVPEEQIFSPAKRTRRLFADDPLTNYLGEHGQRVLHQSLDDLRHPEELSELGMALFLDRPLSVGKAPGEPDRTQLFSYEAFSRSIAERRLGALEALTHGLAGGRDWATFRLLLARLPVEGVGLGPPGLVSRPGAVSVDDARQVAEDVRFLRTTRRSVTEFLDQFDFTALADRGPLDYLTPDRPVLILRDTGSGEGVLAVYDALWRKRLELQVDLHAGYARRSGSEYPAAGLQVLRSWNAAGEPEVGTQGLGVRPRTGPTRLQVESR